MPTSLPADNAAAYSWTQPIRDTITRKNELTDDADTANPKRIPLAALATGTPDGTKFLRDDRTWAVPPGAGGSSTTVPKNTQTASYTLALSDAGKVIEMNSASAVNITIPTNAVVAIPVDTVIELFQMGAGQVSIVSAGGGSFNEPFTTSLALTWATVTGGAISVSGGTQGTLSTAGATVRAEHDVGSSDMFTQANWTAGGASVDMTMGVCTRLSTSANTGYLFEIDDFTNVWTLSKVITGTYTQIGTGSYSPTKPLLMRLESQGTTHRCYAGGTLLSTVTDASITTGQRGGIISYNPTAGGLLFDDFSTGALTSGVTLTKPVSRQLKTSEQGATVGFRKRATDEWVISGELAAA